MPCQTFGTLRSVHRSVVVENKRLDGVLSVILESRSVGAGAQKKVRNVPGKRAICSAFAALASATSIRREGARRISGTTRRW